MHLSKKGGLVPFGSHVLCLSASLGTRVPCVAPPGA